MPIVIPGPANSTSSLQSVPTQQVFDYLYDTQSNPLPGRQVVITLNVADATTITPQVELSSVVIRATTDQNGYWTANLIPNANINPANTTYSVQPPGLDAYQISIPASGGPFQSTSPTVLVNTPGTLAPATTGITGNLSITGNETISGTLGVTGATTLGSTTLGATTQGATTVTGAETVQGDLTAAARLLFSTAVAKIVPGATSLSHRNNADTADNLLIADVGDITVRARLLLAAAVSKLVPGATSFSIRDTGDANDNLLVTNAGNATVRGSMQYASLIQNLRARAYLNGAFSATGNATTIIPLDTKSFDPNTNFNTTTHQYTVAQAGTYLVLGAMTYLMENSPQVTSLELFINAADTVRLGQTTIRGGSAGDSFALSGLDVRAYNLNDTIDIRCAVTGGNAVPLGNNPGQTFLAVFYLSQ